MTPPPPHPCHADTPSCSQTRGGCVRRRPVPAPLPPCQRLLDWPMICTMSMRRRALLLIAHTLVLGASLRRNCNHPLSHPLGLAWHTALGCVRRRPPPPHATPSRSQMRGGGVYNKERGRECGKVPSLGTLAAALAPTARPSHRHVRSPRRLDTRQGALWHPRCPTRGAARISGIRARRENSEPSLTR
jgi:hypothetical protein